MTAPLIVTLALDAESQQRFDRERAELFPPGRTQVGAHVTLFHALPGELLDEVREALHAVAAIPVFGVQVSGLRSLGRGVAYDLEAAQATHLHRTLQRRFADHLTPQDAQGSRLHVTVQNKVDPDVARATLERLREALAPWSATATGLALWTYEGGPWAHVEDVAFSAGSAGSTP